ncbi:MAG TPA: hypothetical protein EYP55_04430 [Anaerolineae bacterium]|nr:hypothetical protein [Anaerolineae bacterium]
MGVGLKTVVGQLRLVAGQWQKEAPNLGVLEPSRRLPLRRDRGNLYVLVEMVGGHDRACQQIIEIVQREFFHTPGSVTLRLRRAIQAANAHLFQENRDVPRDQRRSAGVSCVALKGEEAYIAQAGSALIHVLQGGALHRFPAHSPWLTPTPPQEVAPPYWRPLGVEQDVEVHLSHCRVAPGDVILLSSSNLVRLATEEEIAEAMDQEADVAVKDLAALASGQDVSAIVVEIAPEVEEAEPVPAEVVEEPGALAGVRDFLSRVVVALGMLLRGAITLLGRTLPERETLPRERPAEERVRRALLAGIALAIPLLIAALVGYTYIQQQGVRQARFEALLREAAERRAAALAEPADRAVARELLREAEARVEEALQLRPDDATARSLEAAIQAHLDELSGVVRLTKVTSLATLPEEGSRPQRVVIHGSDLYVLDQGAQRVYRYRLTEAGDGLESPDGEVVLSQGGHLVDMVWVGTGGAREREGLLVLESGGSLLEVDPAGGVTVLPLAESQTWGQPLLTGGFRGNFYLLDSQRNQILKYVPTAQGYDAPPEEWIRPETEVDLSGAVDMAIDGFIYVLLADGTILKLNAGLREPFDQEGLDEPLRDPTALFAMPESRSLYVADAGHRRIVQFGKEGAFQRQFHPPPGSDAFDALWSLWVDEAQGRLYVLNGTGLYMANIPPGEVP